RPPSRPRSTAPGCARGPRRAGLSRGGPRALGGPDLIEQPAVQARVTRQLRVEGDGQDVLVADGDGVAVYFGEDFHVFAAPFDPGRADEDGPAGAAGES